MASHTLIDGQVAELARRLPADAVDELTDGLAETYQRHLDDGLTAGEAATAAIAEFGTTEQITAAFTLHAPGRHAARLLLATGPAVGIWWGISLVAARFWTWPIPTAAVIGFAACLLTMAALLATAATSRHSYKRTRLTAFAGTGLILLDLTMLAAVALLAPAIVWPMAVAIPISLARVGLTLRSLPRLVSR